MVIFFSLLSISVGLWTVQCGIAWLAKMEILLIKNKQSEISLSWCFCLTNKLARCTKSRKFILPSENASAHISHSRALVFGVHPIVLGARANAGRWLLYHFSWLFFIILLSLILVFFFLYFSCFRLFFIFFLYFIFYFQTFFLVSSIFVRKIQFFHLTWFLLPFRFGFIFAVFFCCFSHYF